MRHSKSNMTAVEICAGAGGQALGLDLAGFRHAAAIEIDAHACATLRLNRPQWRVFEEDLRGFSGRHFRGIDLLAGGVPCPPFSIAGKQLGRDDERDLFPEALRLVEETRPSAVLLENVRGLASDKFTSYREEILRKLTALGYESSWRLLNASAMACLSYGLASCSSPSRPTSRRTSSGPGPSRRRPRSARCSET